MNDKKETEITLNLLQVISTMPNITQRSLAQRVGLALGLTNNYLKAFLKDGLIKIEQMPANRYFYHVTAKGLARKSRLMKHYLYNSLQVFRDTRSECLKLFDYCQHHALDKIALIGHGDLVEITQLINKGYHLDITVFTASLRRIDDSYDVYLIADMAMGQQCYDRLIKKVDPAKIFSFSALQVVSQETGVLV